MKKLFFTDGVSKIFVNPPNAWRITGSLEAVVFSPKDLGQATVTISPSRSGKNVPLDEEGVARLRDEALELIRPNAESVEPIYESPSAVAINGWTGFEIMHAYTCGGQSFVRSTLFINLEKDRQIRWVIDALKPDFDKVYPAARATLTTWFEPAVHFPAAVDGLKSTGLTLKLQ